jgi:hypothetical protein
MTDKQKKLIVKYIYLNEKFTLNSCKFDGNDKDEAVKCLQEREDWTEFEVFSYDHSRNTLSSMPNPFTPYLFQNFFDLMGKWLEEK